MFFLMGTFLRDLKYRVTVLEESYVYSHMLDENMNAVNENMNAVTIEKPQFLTAFTVYRRIIQDLNYERGG